MGTAGTAELETAKPAPRSSGFPSRPIGGIMGHARPPAKNHLRRHARHGRARPADLLLGLQVQPPGDDEQTLDVFNYCNFN
jgi:hypothetical protein